MPVAPPPDEYPPRPWKLAQSGSHFDPEVVAAFDAAFADIEAVRMTLLDAEAP